MSTISDISQCVVDGELDEIKDLVQKAVDEGADVSEIINDGLIGGMNIVAPLFKSGEMFVPEVMECADTMNEGMQVVKPLMSEGDVTTRGKVIIGTVNGDLHDIGKNLVVLMMESRGYEVIDLGVDVKEEMFIDAINKHQPNIVGMSSLLTTTMMKIDETIKKINEAGIRDQVKIIVGGAPVTQEFADEIGADGYSDDASTAVEICDQLMAM
ncbi:MAG: corrinoid protein [Eubacterium aggregans]|uniref:5-methyltetrahydrofolate--homocysteine methyltransferase n=1 Tax=Eubacterium aggregans TaxID=81409 RepID=A0A1H4A3I9_9FIRM|nr:corrinoid protein [Eubacterium aggregans]MDD4691647.1 corrinoid protein [Eubacterium aggregans]MEA5074265.1 corrinoid protein [Eubacterium aggregans]SEA30191.1 5-methyltetrahydrofolate--homocysteine methyltransferase [Eubacterium aggregans]